VAIDRAQADFPAYPVVVDYVFNNQRLDVLAETLKKANLDNRFYALPLGWSLANDTRAIIEGQSGRFWECLPDDKFGQAQPGLAQSDCVELLIFYELNKSLSGESRMRVGTQVAISNYLAKREKEESRSTGDENRIIDCYQTASGHTVNFEQAGNIRALIQQWRDKYPHDKELLPFVLATAAAVSTDFKAREQSLNYMSADQIRQAYRENQAIQQLSPADIGKYVRHPEDIAERVAGGKSGNGIGNGDAFRYRPRGLAYVNGKDEYQQLANSLPLKELMDDPDLILIPEFNALGFFYFYFKAESVPQLAAVKGVDWKKVKADDARVTAALDFVRRNGQGRYGYDPGEAAKIPAKSAMFSGCIALAREIEARLVLP
jgi:predicted chitinase